MKKIKIQYRDISRALFAMTAVLISLSLSSCLKDGDQEPEIVAAAMAVNTVPGSDGLVLALDNNQLNNLAAGEWFPYESILAYRRVYPGERLLRVFHPEDVSSNEEITRTTVEFDPSQYYSLFVVGTSDTDMEVVVVADSLKTPEAGTAKIRFVNMSPDAPALALGIEGRDALLSNGTAFKSHSAYTDLEAGEEYRFYIRRAGTDSGENLHEFVFTPRNQYIYTICAKGLFESDDPEADDAFGHGVITH